jgi:hypothetical protein
MERKGIKRGNIFQNNRVPSDLPGLRDQIYRRSRQGRCMQRLADMAGSFRGTVVLVGEGAASSKIKQGQAA